MAGNDKLYIGGVEQDAQRCLRCGEAALDTGWECTECGYDNIEHYCPPEVLARHPGDAGDGGING